MTQSDLGAAFAMPAWKVSRNLDTLQAAGLVERRADPRSRRTHRIHATARARDLLPRLQGIASGVNARILAPLDPAERTTLVALLAQLVLTQGGDG
jgi:MarR family transcriptional regulator, lower aerobic nicotinate degradation pathway regulator